MNECRHGLSEDCPGCMQETIDALAKALRELPSSTEQVEALRESEVTWIVKELGDSIANLGYPVGMGIAPHTEQLKRAAEALFERWCKMASKIACFTPAQRAPDAEIEFEYCNWEGRKSLRQARPISIRFGKSEWHPKPQWLMLAFDADRGAEREFAMVDMAFEDDALASLGLSAVTST